MKYNKRLAQKKRASCPTTTRKCLFFSPTYWGEIPTHQTEDGESQEWSISLCFLYIQSKEHIKVHNICEHRGCGRSRWPILQRSVPHFFWQPPPPSPHGDGARARVKAPRSGFFIFLNSQEHRETFDMVFRAVGALFLFTTQYTVSLPAGRNMAVWVLSFLYIWGWCATMENDARLIMEYSMHLYRMMLVFHFGV
jgi:hypothetical protein